MEERIGGFRLTCPEGFRRMTEEETRGLTTLGEGPWIGLSDPERHMIVTVGWKRLGPIVSRILTGADLAKNAEKRIAASMKPYGFKRTEGVTRTVAGERAHGFRCTYEAQGVAMGAESCVMKRGRDAVYFHVYFRDALREESLPVWEEILASVCAVSE